jgi:hypothetical protein
MKRTTKESIALAARIGASVGDKIREACRDSIVSPAFLAGLVSVENAPLNPTASRFEKGVYANLKNVRSASRFWNRSYNGITQKQLAGMSDDALVNLATSWGYTQIMGYHVLNNLHRPDSTPATLADLRDPGQHLRFAVQLLEKVARPYLERGMYQSVFRIWNTGSPSGETYDPDYVFNALSVLTAFKPDLYRK